MFGPMRSAPVALVKVSGNLLSREKTRCKKKNTSSYDVHSRLSVLIRSFSNADLFVMLINIYDCRGELRDSVSTGPDVDYFNVNRCNYQIFSSAR